MKTETVYTLHMNFPYEFGRIAGVFLTKDAAIAHALTLGEHCKYSIEAWLPSDDASEQRGDEVWSMNEAA